jgi:acyl-CoA synthetase (AMP-forming)/AMP-acid ligase II
MVPEQPFSDYVFEHISQWTNTPAFINGPSNCPLTFAGVARAAPLMTSSRLGHGLVHRRRIFAMYGPNLPEYATAIHGILLHGEVVTTVHRLYTADLLGAQRKDVGATYPLTVPPFIDKATEATA